jgi:LysR family transcriptional regulator, transcriptional activator of the cysJI operon
VGKPQRRITMAQLQKVPLILREKGSGSRMEFEVFLAKHGVSMNTISVFTESESNAAIKRMVRDGNGISVLPDFMVKDDINNGELAEVVLAEGRPMQSFYLVHRKQDSFSTSQLHGMISFLMRNSQHLTTKEQSTV